MEKELTIKEAAQLLGISRQGIQVQIDRGVIASELRDGKRYIAASEVARYDNYRKVIGFSRPDRKAQIWMGGGKGWPKGKPRKIIQDQSS